MSEFTQEIFHRLANYRKDCLENKTTPDLSWLTGWDHVQLALFCKETGIAYSAGFILGMSYTPRPDAVKMAERMEAPKTFEETYREMRRANGTSDRTMRTVALLLGIFGVLMSGASLALWFFKS